jgi:hypothetical protein
MIGQRPQISSGHSTGDREMLEYTSAGDGARLSLLVLHDDAKREYAYGPAQGLPDTKVGTFPQSLYDEAQRNGWIVISMKKDWNRLFLFSRAAWHGAGPHVVVDHMAHDGRLEVLPRFEQGPELVRTPALSRHHSSWDPRDELSRAHQAPSSV